MVPERKSRDYGTLSIFQGDPGQLVGEAQGAQQEVWLGHRKSPTVLRGEAAGTVERLSMIDFLLGSPIDRLSMIEFIRGVRCNV